MNNNVKKKDDEGVNWWAVGAGVAAGAGLLYYLSKSNEPGNSGTQSQHRAEYNRNDDNNIEFQMENITFESQGSQRDNLNVLLAQIYDRYVSLEETDFKSHYNLFDEIFNAIQRNMKLVCPYYNRYSASKQFGGSHYDRLRIGKPDEFDMDIIMSLPVNFNLDPFNPAESDICIEHKSPAYVQLRMGRQFQNLHDRDIADWDINKIAYNWMDEKTNYLLGSKFLDRFKSVVQKALNKFPMQNNAAIIGVENDNFKISLSASGPAVTLIVESVTTHQFKYHKFSVDLVPALRFPETRWPISNAYRKIPEDCNKTYWMVVPKLNKAATNNYDKDRSWRIALHEQEKQLMYKTERLRQSIRFIKKLRDTLQMNEICSYYIKTIFFHEIMRSDKSIWSSNDAFLFKRMVQKLYDAVDERNITYFWHNKYNLIENVPVERTNLFKKKLRKLLDILDDNSRVSEVAKYLLTEEEYNDFYN